MLVSYLNQLKTNCSDDDWRYCRLSSHISFDGVERCEVSIGCVLCVLSNLLSCVTVPTAMSLRLLQKYSLHFVALRRACPLKALPTLEMEESKHDRICIDFDIVCSH